MTYQLQDRGYDSNRHGPTVEVEAETLLAAVRQLPGFEQADSLERYAPGGSLFAVYRRLGAGFTKIGCVADRTPA